MLLSTYFLDLAIYIEICCGYTTTETRCRHSHVWRYLLCARCLAGELLREGTVAGTTPESNKASERGPHPHTPPTTKLETLPSTVPPALHETST